MAFLASPTTNLVGYNPYNLPPEWQSNAVTQYTWTTKAGHTIEQRFLHPSGSTRAYIWLRLNRKSTDTVFSVEAPGTARTYCCGSGSASNCTLMREAPYPPVTLIAGDKVGQSTWAGSQGLQQRAGSTFPVVWPVVLP